MLILTAYITAAKSDIEIVHSETLLQINAPVSSIRRPPKKYEYVANDKPVGYTAKSGA